MPLFIRPKALPLPDLFTKINFVVTKKILLYFYFVLLFFVWKPIFMLYHWDLYGSYPLGEWLAVMGHGLPHDLTVAGYLSALPFLLTVAQIWRPGRWHARVMRAYLRLVAALVLLILMVDIELYTHWGLRLDTTPLIYLTDNPGDAIRQAPTWALVVLPLLMVGLWWVVQRWWCSLFPVPQATGGLTVVSRRLRWCRTGLALFLCALLVLPIRGGVTVSTMNVGHVYYSSDMKLNHAAVNPVFSFLSSLAKHEDLAKQYRFMSDDEAAAAMRELSEMPLRHPVEMTAADSAAATPWLTTSRPNVIVILLESFSGSACTVLTPEANPEWMPSVNRFYDEGIGFMNFYANSFRTDRGVAAVLASYPGQPTHSIMKDVSKSQHLQYFSHRMAESGYDLEFVHGGDADFTNMRSFLRAGGIEHITADVDFPIADRLSKWGVPDHKVFDYLYDDVVTQAEAQAAARTAGHESKPFMKIFLTLSSHEPFDVPMSRFDDPYLNSVAYTDSCLGAFVDKLRDTPWWQDLLIIGLPDHCFAKCPPTIMNHEPLRYHIPMFWVGGAVREPRRITTLGSQVDLGATLLARLDLSHEDFNFSKDLKAPTQPHYAFYTWPDGFGFLTDSVRYIQDNAQDNHPLEGTYDPDGQARRWGKAYLQTLYDDLSRR
jgi:phosphoglycerol transferase MdoB-like AlkP superfamily enzyme